MKRYISRAAADVVAALALPLVALVSGCPTTTRSTPLATVTERAPVHAGDAPRDLWSMRVIGATIPDRQRSGLPWDDRGKPDPWVRIYRDGKLVWESSVVRDARAPVWNATLPRNVWLPRTAELAFELWDDDGALGADPIGVLEHRGLPPSVVADQDARLELEGGAVLVFRISAPRPHRGVGIRSYEVRGDALVVDEVLDASPARRAGLRRGDRIVAIDGRSVEALGEARAVDALGRMAGRGGRLTIVRGDNRLEIALDRGYVWMRM